MTQTRKFNTKAMKVGSAAVKEMYDRLAAGELTQGEAARIYGLGVIQVGRIARGESRAQETGAHDRPVPSFNLQITQSEVEISAKRLATLLAEQEPSGEGVDKLNRLAEKELAVGNELDKLLKGD